MKTYLALKSDPWCDCGKRWKNYSLCTLSHKVISFYDDYDFLNR